MLCVQWVIGHLFLFLLSKISISTLEIYYFFISLSTLEARDQNFKFLFLLSKFEIRISNFSFYSRNSRSESQISLSTLEIRDQNLKFLFLLSNLLLWLSSMPDAYCDEIVIFCLQLWFNTYMPQNQKLKPYIDIIPVKIISTSSESVHSVLTWNPPQLYYQLQSYLWSLNSLSIVSVSEPRWMWMSWWPTSQARHQSDRHHRWTTSTSSVIYLCWLFL